MPASAVPLRLLALAAKTSRSRVALRACAWTSGAAMLAAAGYLIVRSCGYDASLPLRYASYFLLHVLLPGLVVLRWARAPFDRVSVVLALGIPTGFAVEIFTFFALSALQLRLALPWVPAAWLWLACLQWRRRSPGRWRAPTDSELAAGVALSALFLASVVVAVSQMYAESPLVGGWPQRPIFHDWVYLLSRASVIRRHWPIEDPSLAGKPLQYHYFLLVHVAAASLGTGIDVTWILLRLAVVPLGLGLILQAYGLGQRLSGSRGAGVFAAFLVLMPGEVSLSGRYGHPEFLGLFLRWLYVSPTFFFGLIFFGALLLAIPRLEFRPRSMVWLLLLAAAATGAKGSVIPVVLVALIATIAWTIVRDRSLPLVAMACAALVGGGFMAVYLVTMAQWGDGGVRVESFAVCHIAEFWQQWVIPCQRFLKRELHAPDFGTWLGAAVTAAAVALGTSGVKLAGIAAVTRRFGARDRRLARWLLCAAGASVLFGFTCHFDANDELYFLLLMPLPLAVLGGTVAWRMVAWWRACRGRIELRSGLTWIPAALATAVAVAVSAIQVANTTLNLEDGWRAWSRFTPEVQINSDLRPLYETMAWIRGHTEPDAVLLANAFTLRTIPRGRGVLIDHTTAGVNYDYSALSGRRMWIEGPTYLADQGEAHDRLRRATGFFVQRLQLPTGLFHAGPAYVLIDHRFSAATDVRLPRKSLVFSNGTFEVFRLRPPPVPLFAATGR